MRPFEEGGRIDERGVLADGADLTHVHGCIVVIRRASEVADDGFGDHAEEGECHHQDACLEPDAEDGEGETEPAIRSAPMSALPQRSRRYASGGVAGQVVADVVEADVGAHTM